MKYTNARRRYSRRFRKTKAVSKPFARKVQRVIKRTIPRPEVKSVMLTGLEQTLSTLTGILPVSITDAISQGTTSITRIGNTIRLIGIQIKYQLQNNATAPCFVRTSLIKYNDRVTLTTATDMFLAASGGSADIADLLASSATVMRPYDKVFVNKVYHDKVHSLSAYSGEATYSTRTYSRFIKFPRGLVITYNGSSNTIANTTPYLAFIAYSTDTGNDTGAGTTTEMTYQIRVFYTDS